MAEVLSEAEKSAPKNVETPGPGASGDNKSIDKKKKDKKKSKEILGALENVSEIEIEMLGVNSRQRKYFQIINMEVGRRCMLISAASPDDDVKFKDKYGMDKFYAWGIFTMFAQVDVFLSEDRPLGTFKQNVVYNKYLEPYYMAMPAHGACCTPVLASAFKIVRIDDKAQVGFIKSDQDIVQLNFEVSLSPAHKALLVALAFHYGVTRFGTADAVSDEVSTKEIYKPMKQTAQELLDEKAAEDKAKAEALIKKQEEDAKAAEMAKAEALATELDEQNRALAQQQMEEDARRKAELARADTEAQRLLDDEQAERIRQAVEAEEEEKRRLAAGGQGQAEGEGLFVSPEQTQTIVREIASDHSKEKLRQEAEAAEAAEAARTAEACEVERKKQEGKERRRLEKQKKEEDDKKKKMDKLETEKKKNLLVKDDGDRRESALSNIKVIHSHVQPSWVWDENFYGRGKIRPPSSQAIGLPTIQQKSRPPSSMTPVESAKPRAGIPESPGIPRSRAEGAVQPAAQGETETGATDKPDASERPGTDMDVALAESSAIGADMTPVPTTTAGGATSVMGGATSVMGAAISVNVMGRVSTTVGGTSSKRSMVVDTVVAVSTTPAQGQRPPSGSIRVMTTATPNGNRDKTRSSASIVTYGEEGGPTVPASTAGVRQSLSGDVKVVQDPGNPNAQDGRLSSGRASAAGSAAVKSDMEGADQIDSSGVLRQTPVQKTHIDNMRLVQSNRKMSASDGTSIVNVDRPSAAKGPINKTS